MRLTDWTDDQIIERQHVIRAELKELTDEINTRRKRAAKETVRLAALSRDEAGARLREPEGDDLPFA